MNKSLCGGPKLSQGESKEIMPPELLLFLQVILETLTLFVLIVGLLGLIVPVFPGLTIMWLGTLAYAIIQNAAGHMTGWKWLMFALITVLMIIGNIADNLIIARKMRDKYVPWSSILFAFAAGIVVSLFFTPLMGLLAAPAGLFLAEARRLRNREAAIDSTKAYMIGWGWAFGVRFLLGLAMIGFWMLWAWVL
jgi:uncharacterized protein YqgC (DUF456 family)